MPGTPSLNTDSLTDNFQNQSSSEQNVRRISPSEAHQIKFEMEQAMHNERSFTPSGS